MVKSFISLFLLILYSCVYSVVCEETSIIPVSTSSKFTLADLKAYKEPSISCTNDKDCPYGTCRLNVCHQGSFLCREKEDETCLHVNTTLYNPWNEVFFVQYRNFNPSLAMNPILMSCRKNLVKSGACKTYRCYSDSDCFSRSCYSGSCITGDAPVYLCTDTSSAFIGNSDNNRNNDNNGDGGGSRGGSDGGDNSGGGGGGGHRPPAPPPPPPPPPTMSFYCGRQGQMSCQENEDCYSRVCVAGYCQARPLRPDEAQGQLLVLTWQWIFWGGATITILFYAFILFLRLRNNRND